MGDETLGTILWKGKWLVVVAVCVGIALAVLATEATAKVYEATATLQVNTGASSN